MSAVTIVCTTPEAQAFHRALGAYVDALEADPADGRTRGQKLVDCLMDLVLRPGEGDLPPVQALLTIVASVQTALGGDALGEIDGTLVTAEMARELARAFAGQPQPAPAADVGTAHPGGQPRAQVVGRGGHERSPRLCGGSGAAGARPAARSPGSHPRPGGRRGTAGLHATCNSLREPYKRL
jgi:hypothetical protein